MSNVGRRDRFEAQGVTAAVQPCGQWGAPPAESDWLGSFPPDEASRSDEETNVTADNARTMARVLWVTYPGADRPFAVAGRSTGTGEWASLRGQSRVKQSSPSE